MTFGEILQDTGSSRVVFFGDRQSGRTDEDLFQTVETGLFRGSLEDGILDDRVVDPGLAEFATKVGVVGDVDALVFDENTGDGVSQLCCEFRYCLFLLFEYFFACHLRFTSIVQNNALPFPRKSIS